MPGGGQGAVRADPCVEQAGRLQRSLQVSGLTVRQVMIGGEVDQAPERRARSVLPGLGRAGVRGPRCPLAAGVQLRQFRAQFCRAVAELTLLEVQRGPLGGEVGPGRGSSLLCRRA